MLQDILIATIFVSLVSLVGVLLIFRREFLSPSAIQYLVSFAAGVIITVAILDILPEAIHEAESIAANYDVFVFTLLGIVLFFFLERFLIWYHHHDKHDDESPTSSLILLGDGLHNFIDGVAIASAFLLDPALGVASTLAIATHELPQEIADFGVLIHSGMTKSKAIFYNFLSSLTAVIGALLAYVYLSQATYMVPAVLAFSAGTFIYISCADLIPDLHKDFSRHKKWRQTLSFLFGVLFMMILLKYGH